VRIAKPSEKSLCVFAHVECVMPKADSCYLVRFSFGVFF